MNFKSKAFGLIAALAMCLGLTGSALADDSANTNMNVVMTEAPGVLGVQLVTVENFGGKAINAASGTSYFNGVIQIQYTDTQLTRPAFHTTLSATNFVSDADSNNVISAQNLSIIYNYNPAQQRWTHMTNPPLNPQVGDIGALDESGASIGNNPPGYATWSDPQGRTLDQARKVAVLWAGSGTVYTSQNLQLQLAVPVMPAGTYTSTLTATLVAGTP